MLASSAWPVVAAAGITGITAILVGGIGYLGARAHAEAQLRAVEAGEAEARRVAEAARRAERRALYEGFFEIESSFAEVIGAGDPGRTKEWVFLASQALLRIYVNAPTEVGNQANAVRGTLSELMAIILQMEQKKPVNPDERKRLTERFGAERRKLLVTMRADLGEA